MRFAASVSALALASTALAANVVIHVGNNGSGGSPGLFFSPMSVTANVSDTVTFVFDTPGSNHTVAQSAFAKPCEPLADGFDSGYIPGVSGSSAANFTLTITDTKPIWFYCAQPTRTHCTAGMVGAINAPAAPATNDISAFSALATGASSIVQPTPALSGIGAFASASAIAPTVSGSSGSGTATSSATSTATSNAAPAGAKGVSGGVVAALAAAFGVALL